MLEPLEAITNTSCTQKIWLPGWTAWSPPLGPGSILLQPYIARPNSPFHLIDRQIFQSTTTVAKAERADEDSPTQGDSSQIPVFP